MKTGTGKAFSPKKFLLGMRIALLLFLAAAFARTALAHEPVELPATVALELQKAKIPADATGIWVFPLGITRNPKIPSLMLNETKPFLTASIMKIITGYAAAETLGPTYKWKTEVLTRGQINGDVLEGDLIFRGSGDPKLTTENFWLLLRGIRARGIREIKGDIVLDRSRYAPQNFDPAAFDNDPSRPYNAGPDALLLNYRAVEALFRPDEEKGTVSLTLTPALDGFTVVPPALDEKARCDGWEKKLAPVFAGRQAIIEGEYPLSCGEKTWYVSPHPLSASEFFRAAFASMWKELGGRFNGRARDERTPADATLLTEWFSPPLSEVLIGINKHSNNVMTRHVLMTLGAVTTRQPGCPIAGGNAVRAVLARKNIPEDGLIIENGSGLSRIERASPRLMGLTLAHGFHSAVMPELMASMAIAGRDGTLWRSLRQTRLAGRAHLKTGAISEVRSIAGYVLAASGERYAVVFMVNHPNAGHSAKARDALLVWVHDNG